MRKLLLFFAMLSVSIGAWAYSSPTQTFDDGSTFAASDEGSDTQVFTVTAGGIAAWYAAANDAQKSAMADNASRVKLKITGTLSDADLQALGEACFNKFTSIDMSGVTLASGAKISNIRAGSNIDAVALPYGLAKADVNAAGAALTQCNSNFGSCVSVDAETETVTVTSYPYTLGGEDYEADPSAVTDNGDGTYSYNVTSVERTLTNAEGYPVFSYQNPYCNYVTFNVEEDKVSYKEDAWGNMADVATLSEFAVQVIIETWNNNKTYYTDPFTNEQVELTDEQKDNIQEISNNGNIIKYLVVDFRENSKDFSTNGKKYKYQYTDLDGTTTLYTDESTTPDDDMKITLTCNETVTITPVTETVTRPKAGGSMNVVAYVNTAGSLYRANTLAGVSSTNTKEVTISGNITLDDLCGGATRDNLDTDLFGVLDEKYTIPETVNAAWNTDGWSTTSITSFDLEDATLDNNQYLRVLTNFENLETLVFPKNLLSIPDACCYYLTKLKNVTLPPNVQSIGAYAFSHTAIEKVLIRNTVGWIGYKAFEECDAITDVEFEKGLTDLSFAGYVFDSCDALKHIVLPEGVTNIGGYIFNMCKNLDAIRLPTTLMTIGDGAFHECTSIRSLTIPEGVRSIGKQALSLCYIEDLYLMARNVDELPTIYSAGSDASYENSTVASNQIYANGTAPSEANYNDYKSKTSEEMLQLYRNMGSGGGNAITYLHYSEALKDFIDYNPYYYASGADQTKEAEHLSETYVFVDSEGNRWPCAHSPYGVVERGDGSTTADYPRCLVAGDPTAAINADSPYKTTSLDTPSKLGWRQFVLRSSFAPDSPEVLVKQYKDIWYTMCFPWHLTDEQLEEAFSSTFCIAEFTGVKVTEDDGQYTLQLCFDEVAKAQKITDSSYPSMIYSEDGVKDPGYLAVAGHPYMIHPATGTSADQSPVNCYLTGLHPLDYSLETNANYTALAQKIQKNAMIEENGEWVPFTDNNGQNDVYTFIGNISNDPELSPTLVGNYTIYNSGTEEEPNYYKYVPENAYFLAVKKKESDYPRYFREVRSEEKRENGNKAGKWSLYSAVVYPDGNALATGGLEKLIDGAAAGAKGFDIDMFDFKGMADVNTTETTEIEKIVDEAKANNVPVQYMNVVFSINGQVISKDSKDLQNLPKGVYIVNGKKYFVK